MVSPSFSVYLTVTLLYAFMPGPAMLFSVAQTVSAGRTVGLISALGLHLGGYVHILLVSLGLSTLLSQYPSWFMFIHQLGAGYLIWLGIKRVCTTVRFEVNAPIRAMPLSRALIDSIVVNVLNPKAALFYLAFLPQFVRPELSVPIGGQLLMLGALTNVLFSSADAVSVLLSDRLQRCIDGRQRWLCWTTRWAGCVFILLGGYMLFESQSIGRALQLATL